jgi:hypothetical protein
LVPCSPVLVVAGSRSTDPLHSVQDEAALAVATRAGDPAPSQDVAPATLSEVVQRYCVVCHNDQLMTGNVSFQTLTSARAENPWWPSAIRSSAPA